MFCLFTRGIMAQQSFTFAKSIGAALFVFLVSHVGCDGIIGSDKRLDHCGVCGGDNSTCRIVSGLYTMPQLPYGYNLVATIPRGACSVNITELKPSRNYLALRYLNGSYILNGNWAINWSGTYDAVGTAFDYRRDDDSPLSLELLTAKGPTKESVDMMVLSQHTNPGIKYEYTLPLKYDPLLNPPLPLAPPLIAASGSEDAILEQNKLGIVWRTESEIKPVNPVVSKGQQHLHHTRHHKRRNSAKKHHHQQSSGNSGVASKLTDETMPLSDVSSSSFAFPSPYSGRRRVQPSFPANTFNLFGNGSVSAAVEEFSWRVTGFTECSRTCGGGIQKSIVVCMKDHSMTSVTDLRCKSSDRPDSQSLRCNTKPCPPEWVASEWSECSVTCGNGTQSRDISCKQTISSALQIPVADGMCSDPPPELTIRKCSMGLCYHWKAGEWTKCSVNCGKGVRRREIKCVNAAGKSVSSINCESDKKVLFEEGCDMGTCSNTWYFSEWSSQCFAVCGTGTQTRKTHCASDFGLLSKNSCETKKKPEQARSCISDRSCQQRKWFAGPWQQCSSSCGLGVQKRDVLCVSIQRGQHKIITDTICEATEKPSTEQECNLQPCKPEWYMSEWTECSQPCASSFQTREIKCLDKSQKHSDDCDESKRPPSKQNCDAAKCSANESQGDSVCVDKYHSCHLVVQSRLCRYHYYRNMCCDSCYDKHR